MLGPYLPGTTIYPVLEWDVSGLVGTLGVRVIRDRDQFEVLPRSTSNIVESPAGSARYTATVVLPSAVLPADTEYTVFWDDGSTGVSHTAAEDLVISGAAPALGAFAIRDFVETDLPDSALALLVNDATEEATRRFGDDTLVTRDFRSDGGRYLFLNRPAAAVTSIVEYNELRDSPLYTLLTTDYVLTNGGRVLERLPSSTWGLGYFWSPVVRVVYTPVSEANLRNRIIVDLVKLAIQYNGAQSESTGDYSMSSFEYQAEREKILSGFSKRRGFRIA